MDWRHESACRDVDPDLFFPVRNAGPTWQDIERAKSICARCPVITDCLRWALDAGQETGIWGGLTEEERRSFKRRNAAARSIAS